MDGIIFDLDGTLWDPTDIVAKSWNHIIANHSDLDLHIDGPFLKTLFGKPMDEILQAVFPTLTKDEQTRLGTLCFAYENQLLEVEHGTPYEHVVDTLKKLAAHTNLYIVSNCQCGYIDVFLKTTQLQNQFRDFLCFGDTQLPKGKTIRMLMERNNLNDVVYVGDTMGDYQACLDAKIPFVFAEYGFGDVPTATQRISNFQELPSLLSIN